MTLHLDHDHDAHEHEHGDEHVDERTTAVRRAVVLNRVTLAWNVAEAGIALAAAIAAGSVGLLAFGLDSTVEVSASVILAWRLHRDARDGCSQPDDRRAQRAVALSFAALAAYVAYGAVRALIAHDEPERTVIGIVLAVVSLTVMPFLARAKRRLAPVLGSRAQESEADQTSLCALMSGVLLVGLVANAVAGWWWADPLAGLGIAGLAAAAAVRTWRAEALADTCC